MLLQVGNEELELVQILDEQIALLLEAFEPAMHIYRYVMHVYVCIFEWSKVLLEILWSKVLLEILWSKVLLEILWSKVLLEILYAA